MDPLSIMALIAAALPLITQMVQFGEAIAKQIDVTSDPAAKTVLQTVHTAHVGQTAALVSNVAAAIAPKPAA